MSLNPLSEIKYRFRLASENLQRAERLFKLGDWVGTVSSSQIAVENFAKAPAMCNMCNYSKDVEGSTHNPLRHGADFLMSIPKLVVEDRPLVILGAPGIACLLLGIVFGVWMLQIYAVEHRIMTNIALTSIVFVLIGFFVLSTAITLYAISRIVEKTSGKE